MKLFARIDEHINKHIICITESQMASLLMEAMSLGDIHEKYYNKIPEQTFQQIVSADPTYDPQKPNKMGRFGKWLLALNQKGNLKTEDLYKAKDYLKTFVKYYNRIENKDIMKYGSIQELYYAIEPFKNNPEQATSKSDEVRQIKEGAEKVYEDEKWLVVVPHTEEASCYYGKGTEWCTAADRSNNMFEYYNKKGNLYINIVKGTNEKYQFHFETGSFMDATDREIGYPIKDTIGMTEGLYQFYVSKYGESAAVQLNAPCELRAIGCVWHYYIPTKITYDQYLYYFDENEGKLKEACVLDDDMYFNVYLVINSRWMEVCKDDKTIDLYDTKTQKLVFEDENIANIKKFSDTNYLKVISRNGTQRFFDLDTLSYSTEDLPLNYYYVKLLWYPDAPYQYDICFMRKLDEDGEITDGGIAVSSFNSGKPLSDWYDSTKRETIYYKGKPYKVRMLIRNPRDEYDNADILMFDGKIYPFNEFASKSDYIMADFFKNYKYQTQE